MISTDNNVSKDTNDDQDQIYTAKDIIHKFRNMTTDKSFIKPYDNDLLQKLTFKTHCQIGLGFQCEPQRLYTHSLLWVKFQPWQVTTVSVKYGYTQGNH